MKAQDYAEVAERLLQAHIKAALSKNREDGISQYFSKVQPNSSVKQNHIQEQQLLGNKDVVSKHCRTSKVRAASLQRLADSNAGRNPQ